MFFWSDIVAPLVTAMIDTGLWIMHTGNFIYTSRCIYNISEFKTTSILQNVMSSSYTLDIG